eukprot:CAMPEP_0198203774 /NCGR_PEP_ID=MMETSP1445-20131203/7103_1 /TAXON_ID=36898 /ORGANISM="Pyramimonas sp., Strain CCMP2087" /LENGTH=419 /DNA_ID=CAMNT_0043875303 /DNA_START=215 /DNA_END=1474 /DNA_ORIENTATION=-
MVGSFGVCANDKEEVEKRGVSVEKASSPEEEESEPAASDDDKTKNMEPAKRGFTEGKTWSMLFDQTAPTDGDEMKYRVSQLSDLDKCLAILVAEAALPGTFAVILASFVNVQPFAYFHLDQGAVLTAASVLPFLLLDVSLFIGKGVNTEEEQEVELDEKDDDNTIKFVYSMQDAIDDYPGWARDDLSVLFADTPPWAAVPLVALAAGAQELLYRGVLLAAFSYFISDKLVEAGIEGWRLQWGSSSLGQLSAKQLLTVQQPPLMYAALIAFGAIFIFEALNLALSREEGPSVELIDNNEADAGISGNSINIPTNEKGSRAYQVEVVTEDGAGGEEAASEMMTLQVDIMNSSNDVEAIRNMLQTLLHSAQWLVTGNLAVPMLSAALSEALYLVLVTSSKAANPQEDDDEKTFKGGRDRDTY